MVSCKQKNDRTLNTHRLTGVNISKVGFQLLHCPVLETINSLVGVLLVRCLDDKNHRDVYNTWIHLAKPFVFRLNMNLRCPLLFPSCAKTTKNKSVSHRPRRIYPNGAPQKYVTSEWRPR